MNAEELINVLHQIGVQGVTMGSNGWVRALCPYHHETRPSWGILSTEDHHPFSCFSCKAGGSLYRLLIDLTQCSDAAAQQIANKPGPITSKHFSLTKERRYPLPLDESEIFPFGLPLLPKLYLKRRGFSPALVEKLGIVYHHELDRLMFPWYFRLPIAKTFRTELFGVTGRSLNDHNPVKTLPMFGTRKGLCLYVPAKRLRRDQPTILVEGELDAVACYQTGHRNVAATGFGRFTDDQANIILRHSSEVVTFFDDDEAGRHLHQEVVAKMKGLVPVGRVCYDRILNVAQRQAHKCDPAEFLRWKQPAYIHAALSEAEKRSDFPRF